MVTLSPHRLEKAWLACRLDCNGSLTFNFKRHSSGRISAIPKVILAKGGDEVISRTQKCIDRVFEDKLEITVPESAVKTKQAWVVGSSNNFYLLTYLKPYVIDKSESAKIMLKFIASRLEKRHSEKNDREYSTKEKIWIRQILTLNKQEIPSWVDDWLAVREVKQSV